MNLSLKSKRWSLGVLVVVTLGACDATDHPVGMAKQEASEDQSTGGSGASENGTSEIRSGTSTTSPGIWGNPAVEGCGITAEHRTDTLCELEVDCVTEWSSTRCIGVGDTMDCECGNGGPEVSFRLTPVTSANACYYTLALCRGWPELDAEPYACDPDTTVDDPGYCIADADCTREGVIQDAHFTETHHRQSDCTETGDGWACGCGTPNGGIFRLPTATSDPQCVDGFGWCVGEGVERTGDRTCVPTEYQWVDGGTCFAEMACEQPAVLSGQEGTMVESGLVACHQDGSDHEYICRCAELGPDLHPVQADDLEGACLAGVTACAKQ